VSRPRIVIVTFFILRSILHKETKYYDSRSGQQINVLASFYKNTVFLETIKARYNYVFSPTLYLEYKRYTLNCTPAVLLAITSTPYKQVKHWRILTPLKELFCRFRISRLTSFLLPFSSNLTFPLLPLISNR